MKIPYNSNNAEFTYWNLKNREANFAKIRLKDNSVCGMLLDTDMRQHTTNIGKASLR